MIEDNNVEIDAIIEDDSVNLETDLDYRGERGPVGETPDITIGKVDTLSPEDNAYVEKEGTKENITLNFGIPKGETGDIGPVGPTGPSGVYIGSDEPQDPEVDVWIDPTVTPENYVKEKELDDKLNSMIESGELIGPQGVPGTNGKDGVGITTIISGQSTVEDDKTVTPVIVEKSDGSSQSFKVEAKNGIDGQNGKDGQDGVNGQDGLTPTIGDNGNWFIGDTDTGKPSRGEVGPTPDLTDYVKNTDYATTVQAGVVRLSNGMTIDPKNGNVFCVTNTNDNYKNAGKGTFISKGTLENIKNDYIDSSTPVQELNNNLDNIIPKNTASGEIVSVDDALAYKTFNVTVDGASEQVVTTGKNLYDGVNQGYYLNNGVKLCGYTEADSGFAINVSQYSQLTVSTQSIQERYRVGCVDSLPTGGGTSVVPVFNGVNKDGTNDSITVDTTDYNYLIINATNLSVIQVEEGSVATSYEPYTGGQPSPSPDYPQEITTLTFDKITRCGKNLYNYEDMSSMSDGVEVDDEGWMTFTFDNTQGSNIGYLNYFTKKLNLKTNQEYNVFLEIKEVTGTGTLNAVSFYNSSDPSVVNNQGQFINSFSYPFASVEGGKTYNKIVTTRGSFENTVVSLRTFASFAVGQSGSVTFRLSLLENTSVTSQNFIYEPYQGQSYDIDLQGNEMVELPNGVKDDLVVDKYGNVSLIKNVGKKILNGSEDWMLNTNYTTSAMLVVQYLENDMLLNSRIVSDKFTYNAVNEIDTIKAAAQFVLISLDIKKFATVDDFKTWLSTHNTTVYYQLANPQPISLGKLSDIITTLNGTNNISINGNIPTTISTTYALDIKKYIDNKLAEISTAMIEEG